MINKLKRKFNWPTKFSWKSITLKWTILTSLVISILFAVFAVISYQISSRLMIQQEELTFNRTISEVTSRLSRGTEPLSFNSSVFYLKESTEEYVGEGYYGANTLESTMMNLNSFISELSRPEMDLKVYNADGDLVFETKNRYVPFDKKAQSETTIKTYEYVTGLVLLKPVYSNQTGKLMGYAQGFYDLGFYYKYRKELLKNLVIIGICGLLVSVMMSFLLSSYFTSPLRKMVRTLNNIETAHKTGLRMPVPKSHDEIYDLAKAFNDMIERMERFITQQQQFVEDVSHELRTPVAVIEGHLNLLNRWGKDDPEVLEESLSASLQEITRMKSLVQEMLDLSRAEQSEFHYKNETCLAKETIQTTVNNFQMLYPEFVFNLDDDDLDNSVEIKMYRNHFEQILIILLDNAVKYSRDRKEVIISASKSYQNIDLMIQDFGEGISEEEIEKVFNRFYRVDKARARHTGGNGLGLSIAQQLIENYNGTINVKSHVGLGTAFYLSIPYVVKQKNPQIPTVTE